MNIRSGIKSLFVGMFLVTLSSGCASPNQQISFPIIESTTPTFEENFSLKVNPLIEEYISGFISLNIPEKMNINEVATVDFLVKPFATSSEFNVQIPISERGLNVVFQITPRMMVDIISVQADAFTIQPLHADAAQVIDTTQTTKWSWQVIPKMQGERTLTLTINNSVVAYGVENWQLLDSKPYKIEIQATILDRILMLDWKWIAWFLFTLAGVVVTWRKYKNKPAKDISKKNRANRKIKRA